MRFSMTMLRWLIWNCEETTTETPFPLKTTIFCRFFITNLDIFKSFETNSFFKKNSKISEKDNNKNWWVLLFLVVAAVPLMFLRSLLVHIINASAMSNLRAVTLFLDRVPEVVTKSGTYAPTLLYRETKLCTSNFLSN